ncbi:AI-2E family transporter [Candidatus Woesearchaeota archaeon]|nr:AI-2E family transporter [Candidatus Woesearchaeota archaeon]
MKDYKKHAPKVLLLISFVLSFIIVLPYLKAILASFVIAYIFYPLYRWFYKKTGWKNRSALIVSIIIVLIAVIPLILLINTLSQEVRIGYLLAKQQFGDGMLFTCQGENIFCSFIGSAESFMTDLELDFYLGHGFSNFSDWLFERLSETILAIPSIMLNIFISIFITFFLFRDGPKFLSIIKNLLHLKKSHQHKIFKRLEEITFAVVYGTIIVALIQGTIAAIGFLIFGISNPVLGGIATAIAALIPFIGTILVWGPVSFYQIVFGLANGDSSRIFRGFGLLLYGFFIISTIDNIIKPKIIGDRAKIHPVLVLLGVLGGLSLLGFIGLFVGPVILALMTVFLQLSEEDFQK